MRVVAVLKRGKYRSRLGIFCLRHLLPMEATTTMSSNEGAHCGFLSVGLKLPWSRKRNAYGLLVPSLPRYCGPEDGLRLRWGPAELVLVTAHELVACASGAQCDWPLSQQSAMRKLLLVRLSTASRLVANGVVCNGPLHFEVARPPQRLPQSLTHHFSHIAHSIRPRLLLPRGTANSYLVIAAV